MEKQEVKDKAIQARPVQDGKWEMRMRGLSDNLAHLARQSILDSYRLVNSEARGTDHATFSRCHTVAANGSLFLDKTCSNNQRSKALRQE